MKKNIIALLIMGCITVNIQAMPTLRLINLYRNPIKYNVNNTGEKTLGAGAHIIIEDIPVNWIKSLTIRGLGTPTSIDNLVATLIQEAFSFHVKNGVSMFTTDFIPTIYILPTDHKNPTQWNVKYEWADPNKKTAELTEFEL